jgi:transcription elongation factor Elf1
MSTRAQYRTAPARIQAYIDCPKCGRISMPEAEMMVALGSDSPSHVHCHFKCKRCGSRKALLHLEREILSRH